MLGTTRATNTTELEEVQEDVEVEHPVTVTEQEHSRGASVNIIGRTDVVPNRVLNMRHRVRDISQHQILLTSKMVAHGTAEGVGREFKI